MKIRALKLRVATSSADFGFAISFSNSLTIIRGGNSSGKSTIVNTLLYALGMEELVGGKGDSVLQYAVKDHFMHNSQRVEVLESETLLEIENKDGDIATFRRAIKSETKNHKLVEILHDAAVTASPRSPQITSTYLFDPGAAQQAEGFHHFLESFLGLDLPPVPTSSGGEAKLYIQTIFSAIAVEQKRGWSDYAANIPYFGIRDARTRVVEFLLGLGVFELAALKNQLNQESQKIALNWESERKQISKSLSDLGLAITGIPEKPTALFKVEDVSLTKRAGQETIPLVAYVDSLRTEYDQLDLLVNNPTLNSEDARQAYNAAIDELSRLTHLFESLGAEHSVLSAARIDYERILAEVKEDLARNKASLKLKNLGAKLEIATASDKCPTCEQAVDTSLLSHLVTGPQMDIEENIRHLNQQAAMLGRQIAGTTDALERNAQDSRDVSKRMAQKSEHLSALRADVSQGTEQSRSLIRRQMQIQSEANALRRAEADIEESMNGLLDLAKAFAVNLSRRKALPPSTYSSTDAQKIGIFEKLFRANAASFGYESANISDIEINRDTLTPYLAQMELREVTSMKKSDIRTDSSASDFVRLIWSYLIGLYQTSKSPAVAGNHPGLLIFDEPGQHSMAEDSQRALLNMLSHESGLQAIVAASFDESEAVFRKATQGLTFKLIQWEGKSIAPIGERTFLE